MAKKTRREKELARLRREVEFLKAQKPREKEKIRPQIPADENVSLPQINVKYIKADLLKTAVLTAIAFATIALAYLLRSQIPYF